MKRFSNPVAFIKLITGGFLLLLFVLSAIAIVVAVSGTVFAGELAENEPEIYVLDAIPAIEPQNVEAEKIEMPAAAGLVDLLRSTLLMVNTGNKTGDYSLLYSNLTPPVQKNVDVDQLAKALTGFREEKLDMSAVSVVHPQFSKPPEIDANGVLNLNGYFPTQPRILKFNLGYRKLNGSWRLEAIDLDAPASTAGALQKNPVGTSNQVETSPSRRSSEIDTYIEPPTTTKW